MNSKARLVIIGAGIVGCSTAYHLARRGWSDIVVVDQGPLFKTGGSTSHAPGGLSLVGGSRLLVEMAQYGLPLYRDLTVGGVSGAELLGGLEVAISEPRLMELKRRAGWGKSFGVDCELLDANACRERAPHLDAREVLGGLFTPGAGIGRPVVACEALAREAQADGGVSFFGGTKVVGFRKDNGRISAVLTDKGDIQTDLVLVCAGIWGPVIGAMAGVTVPLQPMEHLYATFGPIPELAAYGKDIALPIVRIHDVGSYCRMHGGEFGIGVYDHAPLPFEADAIASHDTTSEPSKRPFTAEHLSASKRVVDRLFPMIAGKPQTGGFNGMFSFTPDGMPILGEHAQVPGLWLAEAVWFTHGAGVGKIMASWLDTGHPGCDIRDADINRFPRHALTHRFIRERGAQTYVNTHAIVHPASAMSSPRDLRRSPLQPRLEALGAVFTEVGGWERPHWFEANRPLLQSHPVTPRTGWEARHWSPIQGAEHLATRRAAALFDLSITAKTDVRGPDALRLLQAVCTADIDVPVGRAVYTLVCDVDGGIRSEAHVVRLGGDRFRLFSSGPLSARDRAWMEKHARDRGLNAFIDDTTSAWSTLGLWGPEAAGILAEAAGNAELPGAMPLDSVTNIEVGAVPVMAIRTSKAPEQGFDLQVPSEFALALWDALWASGRNVGLIAGGTGAIDSLRIEAGLLRMGFDAHGDVDPFAAGLETAVDLTKPDFIGRSALLAKVQHADGRKLALIQLDRPDDVLMGREPISIDGHVVGYVSSTNTGHSTGRQLAYGYLPHGMIRPGSAVTVEYFGEGLPGTITEVR